MLEIVAAEHLGQFSGGEAPHSIHLEQSVLRGHVTLREEKIIEIGSVDGGRSVVIANDRHWRRESRHCERAIQLGQSRTCHRIKPGADTQPTTSKNHDQDNSNDNASKPETRTRIEPEVRVVTMRAFDSRAWPHHVRQTAMIVTTT